MKYATILAILILTVLAAVCYNAGRSDGYMQAMDAGHECACDSCSEHWFKQFNGR